MIIVYEDVQREGNMTMSLPIMVDGCCKDSVLWFFKYSIDVVIKDNLLLKRDASVDNKPQHTEVFSFCQFCGEKHRCYSKEEYQEKCKLLHEAKEVTDNKNITT